ncbi:MAG: aminotransferase class V-fold PLP-dependent enzyme [Alphaproteobacteria bacterium]|nr:aminotransferase class V-fold PLP-dependent enzyme [Alphaproteobacteria bacterium]
MTELRKRHYLDYNATAPARPEVIEAVAETMRNVGNSSSVHAEGRAARAIIEDAREKLRALVNAPVNGVIFTSGGTEAIHYAINGTVKNGTARRIFVSAIEHAAVPSNAAASGAPVETIPVTESGVVDLDWMRERLKKHDATEDGGFLVCLMYANNETGVIQPVREAAEIVHEAGGLLFVDAAQAVGKIPVNFVMSGADMMAATGHKFGGPLGVGALIVAPNLPLEPVMRGGGHEMNRRAGTSNAPAIAGLGKACEIAAASFDKWTRIEALRDRMQDAAEAAGARIWGKGRQRLPGTLSLSAAGFASQTQLMAMDLAGIAISSGSACSSGKTKPSHVLAAMGASEEEATSAIRVSLGWASTEDDAEAFIREWPAAYARVKARAA